MQSNNDNKVGFFSETKLIFLTVHYLLHNKKKYNKKELFYFIYLILITVSYRD